MTAAPVSAASPSTRSEAPPRRVGVVLAVVGVMLVSIALPFFFLTQQADGFHTAFHIIGILLIAVGVWVHRRLRRGATRTVKVMSWIVTVLLIAWGIGHLGELVTVLTTTGVAHDHETFDQPVHMLFAEIAVPSWALSVLMTVVLLVVIGVQALVRRARR